MPGRGKKSKMFRPATVIIAYNRPDALKRLLTSVEAAVYPEGASVPLVISIDRSDSDDVVKTAEAFEYTHGEKIIIARKERLGLKEHVLTCGDLTDEYGSIIVLEDDLFVSPMFYDYACAALSFSDDRDIIGSISLYDHLFNVHKREGFRAIDDGYDNYYLQLASSWGQAYTKKQWAGFRAWYEENKDADLTGPGIPANVSGWSERSWLKYYIVYLIRTGRFTLYPRGSLTTNFGEMGTHSRKHDTDLQVPLINDRIRSGYDFSAPENSKAVYDSFFEPLGSYRDGHVILGGSAIPDQNGRGNKGLVVDLYGIKPVEELADKGGYILSSRQLPYRIIRSYGRQMRPVDANIVYGIEGNDYHLYCTDEKSTPPASAVKATEFLYEYRGISLSRMFEMIKYRILERFGRY